MPPLAVSGPAIIAAVVVFALLLTWALLRLEGRDEAEQDGDAER